MSAAIHYYLFRNDGYPITGIRWTDKGEIKPAGLESLLEFDIQNLQEAQTNCNEGLKQLESETHRAYGRFSWERGFTGINYEGEDRIALLLFKTVVDVSKRLPSLKFEFNDSYYFNVLYMIQNGALVELPEIQVGKDLWAWDGLDAAIRNKYLEEAQSKFQGMVAMDPTTACTTLKKSDRLIDFYYIMQDVSINPSAVFEGAESRFLSVHHSNGADVAINGKSNYDNLTEVVPIMRHAVERIRSYMDLQTLEGIGGSEEPGAVVLGMEKGLRAFQQLLDGSSPRNMKSDLHKYRIEMQIFYVPTDDLNQQRLVHNSPPKISGTKLYIGSGSSDKQGVSITDNIGAANMSETMQFLVKDSIQKISQHLCERKDLKWYEVVVNIYD